MNTTFRIVSNKTTLRFPASLPGEKGEAANRSGCVMVSPSATGSPALTTGTSKAVVRIPSELGGMVLTDAGAGVSSPSTSGPVSVQIRRVRAGVSVNMLTTEITIDQDEYDSVTAAAGSINPANRAVQAGDHLHFDVTAAGNNARGLVISFTFQPTQ
jgi:hypothetical protein